MLHASFQLLRTQPTRGLNFGLPWSITAKGFCCLIRMICELIMLINFRLWCGDVELMIQLYLDLRKDWTNLNGSLKDLIIKTTRLLLMRRRITMVVLCFLLLINGGSTSEQERSKRNVSFINQSSWISPSLTYVSLVFLTNLVMLNFSTPLLVLIQVFLEDLSFEIISFSFHLFWIIINIF